MLVSPAPTNATLQTTLWGKLKKKGEGKEVMAIKRMVTLVCEDLETLKLLPDTYADLEKIARNWVKPPDGAPFHLRVPTECVSVFAARYVQGPYIMLNDDDTYQLVIQGQPGLRVEIITDNLPPDEPPPPPPPPVLEMPATFNLELAPGHIVAIDTICESDELDMSRTEDGTVVGGMFMGKLDIVHDHAAKVHKMEFTGTRLKDEEYTPDFFFDQRTMGRLTIAAQPPVARCQLSVLTPDQQYCDVTLKLMPVWRLGQTWPLAEKLSDQEAKFFLRVHPGGALEHFESETVVTSLYYEAIPDAGLLDATMINPSNAFAMSSKEFLSHIGTLLESFGLSMHARTHFVNYNLSQFMTHKNIAYRLMSPTRLAAAIDISVTCAPCVWTRIFLLYRGVTDDEITAFAGRSAKEAADFSWKDLIGWTEAARDKAQNRVVETSIMEIA